MKTTHFNELSNWASSIRDKHDKENAEVPAVLKDWKHNGYSCYSVLAAPASLSRTPAESHGSPQPRTILPTHLSFPVKRF